MIILQINCISSNFGIWLSLATLSPKALEMEYIGQHTIGSSQFNKFKEKNSSKLDKNTMPYKMGKISEF